MLLSSLVNTLKVILIKPNAFNTLKSTINAFIIIIIIAILYISNT